MMKKYKDIEIGDIYGRWTVRGYSGKKKNGSCYKDYWNCDCQCGNNKDVLGEILKNGRSNSCGCLQKEIVTKMVVKNRIHSFNVGDKVGNWTVLGYYGKSPNDETKNANTYLCECNCYWHTRKILYASHLANGTTNSCIRCAFFKDIVGNRYGRLLVLNLDVERSNIHVEDGVNRIYYICQCDCGNVVSIRRDSIVARKDKENSSCGCVKYEFSDLTGNKYGMLTILSYYDTVTIQGDNYVAHRRRWKCECDCGSVKVIREEDLINGCTTSCGCRKESLAEAKTKKILNNWGIKYISEYRFDDCIDEKQLPFDFYIPSNKICIELDGEDHYKPVNRGNWSNEKLLEVFENRQRRDDIKTEYCKSHKIKLIRIPYWDFDDIEYILFDKLVKYKVLEEIKVS